MILFYLESRQIYPFPCIIPTTLLLPVYITGIYSVIVAAVIEYQSWLGFGRFLSTVNGHTCLGIYIHFSGETFTLVFRLHYPETRYIISYVLLFTFLFTFSLSFIPIYSHILPFIQKKKKKEQAYTESSR